MSEVSNFSFIHDEVLRENLDITFDHLLELLSLSESSDYTNTLKSSFRKTVIIYTASVIEALLLWMLKENKTEDQLSKRYSVFEVSKVIYEINEKEQGFISKDIFDNIDKVRTLRNRLHISTLRVIEKDYSKTDLEFVFSVAREVKNLVKRQYR